jgi:hypothetical protein
MTTKLTLSADIEVVRKAHRVAKRNATSVSAMFARFVRALPDDDAEAEIGPLARQATGLAKKGLRGASYRDVLTDALMEKYGLR